MNKETEIIINGKTLTFAQVLSIQTAINHFCIDMKDTEIRLVMGEMADLYLKRLYEVQSIMANTGT